MKKIGMLVVFLILIPAVIANNFQNLDSFEVELGFEGDFHLEAEKANYEIKEAHAELFLMPQNNHRQEVIDLSSAGKIKNNSIEFYYDRPEVGEYGYGYTSIIKTVDKQVKIKKKLDYPLKSINGLQEYIQPTKSIDSENPYIIKQATDLVEGKDDLFDIVFTLAQWTEENIKYNLTTLTSDATLPASWVLKNRMGVCDEMTSLFIAMARSLGIPARFVKGVSYTSSEYFDRSWLPHGWAEVYFPNIGWVSFDPTFGEYGFVDVTHFKLRDSIDPTDPDVIFELLGYNTKIVPRNMEPAVNILYVGNEIESLIDFSTTTLRPKVGFGSYTIIQADLQNLRDYYIATTLKLVLPEEIRLVGRDRKSILLRPSEEKQINWVVQVPETLEERYTYTFPFLVFSERNESVGGELESDVDSVHFSLDDIRPLVVEAEEKKYNKKVGIDCEYPEEVDYFNNINVSCTITNQGNQNIRRLKLCIEDICRFADLPINQKLTTDYNANATTVGNKKLAISASSPDIERKIFLDYLVLDKPDINLSVSLPTEVFYGEQFDMILKLEKNSFTAPKNIIVNIKSRRFVQEITLSELTNKQNVVVPISTEGFVQVEQLIISVSWEDHQKKEHTKQDTVNLKVLPRSIIDRIIMFINNII